MQKLTLSIGATLLSLASAAFGQQIYFGYGTEKEFVQDSSAGPKFDGGRFSAILRDGLSIYQPGCALNGSIDSFGPIVAPGINCPIGGTGLISSGNVFLEEDLDDPDVDAEPILADNTYWQVTNILRAKTFEPFRPELCRLVAAPASALPRPLDGFEELGVIVFYNMRTPEPEDYNIARYEFERFYGSWPADDEVETSEGSPDAQGVGDGAICLPIPCVEPAEYPSQRDGETFPFRGCV